jgi:hypothetical protein
MDPVNLIATLFNAVVFKTVANVYDPDNTTVPPLLHVARAALIAGPSSDVPPATVQVAARAAVTDDPRTRRLRRKAMAKHKEGERCYGSQCLFIIYIYIQLLKGDSHIKAFHLNTVISRKIDHPQMICKA